MTLESHVQIFFREGFVKKIMTDGKRADNLDESLNSNSGHVSGKSYLTLSVTLFYLERPLNVDEFQLCHLLLHLQGL